MLTEAEAAIVKGLLLRGEKQHDIAAFFRENGGRIAEIATGQKYPDVKAAAPNRLPAHDDLAGTYPVHVARMVLLKARREIDAALRFLEKSSDKVG